MAQTETTTERGIEVFVPTGDLHAWPVRTEDGEFLGHVRGVHTDPKGHIVSLDVRERWILGPHHQVPAGGMRIAHGAVVVPRSAAHEMLEREVEWLHAAEVASSEEQRRQPLPVFVEGHEGARRRFGGIDIVGSLLGALVGIAVMVLVGVLLEAGFDTGPMLVDTSFDSWSQVTSGAMLACAATLVLSGLLGGWAAGRGSRFDGIANGLVAMAWLLAAGLGAAWLGRDAGDEWNAFAVAGIPDLVTAQFEPWGVLAFVLLVALMLGAAAIGGSIGEGWHRRADRVMLDVVPLAPGDPRRPPRRRRHRDGMPG